MLREVTETALIKRGKYLINPLLRLYYLKSDVILLKLGNCNTVRGGRNCNTERRITVHWRENVLKMLHRTRS